MLSPPRLSTPLLLPLLSELLPLLLSYRSFLFFNPCIYRRCKFAANGDAAAAIGAAAAVRLAAPWATGVAAAAAMCAEKGAATEEKSNLSPDEKRAPVNSAEKREL